MFTFSPYKVRPNQSRLSDVPATQIWEAKLTRKPEAFTGGKLVNSRIHPLVAAVGYAYNRHLPLRLTPDMIWLTISQGLATHINENAEELRSQFVAHEGKVQLRVVRNMFQKGSPDNDWPGVFPEFSDGIAEYIGKKRDLIVSDFSTTTPIARAASEITLMDAMQAYFDYHCYTMCAFPSITLDGTVADWESILVRVQNLSEFGLSWWTDHLIPVLEQFVRAAKGDPDLRFWARAYAEDMGSGAPNASGWIVTFFPYLEMGAAKRRKNHELDWAGRYSGPPLNSYPTGLAVAPFEWHYYTKTYPMQFVGGLVGVEQLDDGTVQPSIGWAVADRDAEGEKDGNL